MRKNNKRTKRKANRSYLIVVDGQTEIWYLQLMKEHEKLKGISVKPELPKRKKLRDLYNMVEKESKDYDKVIWVLDLDLILDNRQINEFKKYVNALNKNKRVIILVNNPCLELWFLLHFKKTHKIFYSCANVIKELKKYVNDYDKSEKYYKGNTNLYGKLKSRQKDAIRNAKVLGCLDFDNIESSKAEIYKIFDIITDNNIKLNG